MRNVENAYNKLEKKMDADGSTMGLLNFIKIENKKDVKGVAPIVSFTIQSDPIGEVGINGCQALDMLKYVACLFESLNEVFPSSYNETSLAHIENAIQAQNLRTADALFGVPGRVLKGETSIVKTTGYHSKDLFSGIYLDGMVEGYTSNGFIKSCVWQDITDTYKPE